jgi:hypothetical protein
MTTPESLHAALTAIGYVGDAISYRYSRSTGGGFVWGPNSEFGAPDTAAPEFIAAMVAETLR